jgi:NDP-sugar pyrophosphorylase family protein
VESTAARNGARHVTNGGLADVSAVILAGGRGTRLAPYTSVLPKPLMPIGDRAILELVVDQLVAAGVEDFTFCVGYLSQLIRTVFDHRDPPGANISYVHEAHPLGTAAPLRLIDRPGGTFLVMNGDVLSNVDYRDLVAHHRSSGNIVTIATYAKAITMNYGVIHVQSDRRVRTFEEKPRIVSDVSMGIYAFEPDAVGFIPDDGRFDFPDLVRRLLANGERVGSYRHDGFWFDIGNHDDYVEAVELWERLQHAAPETPRRLRTSHEVAATGEPV